MTCRPLSSPGAPLSKRHGSTQRQQRSHIPSLMVGSMDTEKGACIRHLNRVTGPDTDIHSMNKTICSDMPGRHEKHVQTASAAQERPEMVGEMACHQENENSRRLTEATRTLQSSKGTRDRVYQDRGAAVGKVDGAGGPDAGLDYGITLWCFSRSSRGAAG